MSSLIPFDLPRGDVLYPEELNKMRDALLEKFRDEQEHPNFRRKLILIAEAFTLFAQQIMVENMYKARA